MKVLSKLVGRFRKPEVVKTPFIILSRSERRSFEDAVLLNSLASESLWDMMRRLSVAYGFNEWETIVSGFTIHFKREGPESYSVSHSRTL